jgi:CHAT domain-containing protein/tetratricopeptide (TPR) repeat protein
MAAENPVSAEPAPPPALLKASALEREAQTLFDKGDYPGAVPLLEQAYGLRKDTAGERAPDTMGALSNYATILARTGRAAEAEPLAARLLALRREILGPRDPATLGSINTLASILLGLGRAAEAEPLLAEALRLRREVLGERHPDTLEALSNFGYLLSSLGRNAEAAPMMAEALRLRREVLGPNHPSTLISTSNLAAVLLKLGRGAEAKPMMAEVLRATGEVRGERHPDTILALNNYGALLLALGEMTEALPLLQKAAVLDTEVLGETNPQTLQAYGNYGGALLKLGRLSEAEQVLARSLALRRSALGRSHPLTLEGLNNHAYVLNALGRPREAEAALAEALQARRETLGPSHPDTLESLLNYAGILRLEGREAEAVPLIEEAYRLRRETQGERHPETLGAMNAYATALAGQGRPGEAEPLLLKLIELRREVQGAKHPDTIDAIDNYGSLLASIDQFAKADPVLAEAESLSRTLLGDRHPDTIARIQRHATVLLELKRFAEAEMLYQEAERTATETLGKTHATTLDAVEGVAMARLSAPGRAALAFEPAARVIEAASTTDAADDATALASQASRDHDRASRFVLYAEAAWARGRGLANAPVAGLAPLGAADEARLEADTFVALQNATTNVTSRALARTAALRAATRAGVGAVAAERDRLLESRRALDAAVVKSYATSGAEADMRRQGLQQDLAAIATRLAAIDDTLRARASDYFALTQPTPLTLAQARVLLGPKEAALLLVPTRSGTQVMLVTREGLRWHHSDMNRDDLTKRVRRLLWDVGGDVQATGVEAATWGDEGEGATPYDFGSAFALYHELIEPIAAGLDGKTQLFVSSTGALSSLPLGILVSEVPKGADGDPTVLRGAKWLADRVAISVIPSLQSLQFIRQFRGGKERRKPAGASYLGFGDPVLDGVASQRGGGRKPGGSGPDLRRVFAESASRGADIALASPAELRKLARLPETRVEIENQWQAFGKPANAVFLGDAATETRVKHTSLSAGVISFATHGLLAGELKGAAEPGLVLTPPTTASADDDGFLTASEISALKVDTGWVILSACNTAAGDGSAGAPGLSGLSRAFFYAGATNLLVSHWPVRDDVASKLTVRAIEIARDTPGLSRAQAVQRAEQEIRNNPAHDTPKDSWAHPSAWAPFSLVGDGAR